MVLKIVDVLCEIGEKLAFFLQKANERMGRRIFVS